LKGKIEMKKKLMLTCLLGLALGMCIIACDEDGSENIALHPDLMCRYDADQGIPFLIGRGIASFIDVLDPADDFEIVTEYSVKDADGVATNPYDIAVVSADRAYVSRYDTPSLLVVHPTDGTVLDTVDISDYADADGNPEASYMYSVDGKIYLAIQRLDSMNFTSTDYSAILVIDGDSGEVEQEIRTTATNPGARIRYHASMDRLVIVSSGDFGMLDGGIEFLNPGDNSLSGLVVTEEALDGDIVDAVVVSETKGYAIVGVITDWDNFTGETYLVSFNPQTGEKLGDVAVSDSWDYNAIELNPDGTELWLADAAMTNPGIRIFDVETDEEKTEDAIDVGLPPFAICFIEDEAALIVTTDYETGSYSTIDLDNM
jgi:outer membrane protein assembly factor BamB